MNVLRFLVIRFSSMGDIVVSTAVLGRLKAAYGQNVHITFVTSLEFKALVENHPWIDEVVTFDRRSESRLRGLAKNLKSLHASKPFDLILDLHATTRSTILRLLLWRIPRLVIDKRRIERTILIRVPGGKWKRGFQRFLGMRPLAERVSDDWKGLLHLTKATEYPLTKTPSFTGPSHAKPYVVFAPVASFAPKRWPIQYFVKLAQEFLKLEKYREFDLIIIAGPDDTHCEAFREIPEIRLLNLQGKTKLQESMSWVQGARLVVGNDSGMNHIAEAAGVHVITLFGPTHEAFGFAPHLPGSRALSTDPWCRPCSATGKRPCFRSEQVCFTELTPDIVLKTMIARLESA